jgi:uncharacterized protein (DUF1778 family)
MKQSPVEPQPKRERLEARITADQKALLQRAAALQGSSLSDFVINGALQAAEEVIRSHTLITLSADESRAFVDALLNPLPPNDALRAAVEQYRLNTEEAAP